MGTLSIARVYLYSFHSHPTITLAITGACLNSLGDIVAQFTEKVVNIIFYSIHNRSINGSNSWVEQNMTIITIMTTPGLSVSSVSGSLSVCIISYLSFLS